jgi:hypothetical protein
VAQSELLLKFLIASFNAPAHFGCLARLYQRTDKTNGALRILTKAYRQLPKGGDTPDLQAAKELLDESSAR